MAAVQISLATEMARESDREDAEAIFETKVFLDLYVRVKENWRESDFNISNFGYKEEQ